MIKSHGIDNHCQIAAPILFSASQLAANHGLDDLQAYVDSQLAVFLEKATLDNCSLSDARLIGTAVTKSLITFSADRAFTIYARDLLHIASTSEASSALIAELNGAYATCASWTNQPDLVTDAIDSSKPLLRDNTTDLPVRISLAKTLLLILSDEIRTLELLALAQDITPLIAEANADYDDIDVSTLLPMLRTVLSNKSMADSIGMNLDPYISLARRVVLEPVSTAREGSSVTPFFKVDKLLDSAWIQHFLGRPTGPSWILLQQAIEAMLAEDVDGNRLDNVLHDAVDLVAALHAEELFVTKHYLQLANRSCDAITSLERIAKSNFEQLPNRLQLAINCGKLTCGYRDLCILEDRAPEYIQIANATSDLLDIVAPDFESVQRDRLAQWALQELKASYLQDGLYDAWLALRANDILRNRDYQARQYKFLDRFDRSPQYQLARKIVSYDLSMDIPETPKAKAILMKIWDMKTVGSDLLAGELSSLRYGILNSSFTDELIAARDWYIQCNNRYSEQAAQFIVSRGNTLSSRECTCRTRRKQDKHCVSYKKRSIFEQLHCIGC